MYFDLRGGQCKLLIPQAWSYGSEHAMLESMTGDWEGYLERWTAASLVDAESAGRIRAWESARSRGQGLGWPVRIALAFGAMLLAAGVLLFVSAHWHDLSRAGRLSMLAATVAVLHGCGAAAARRFEALGVALHAVGSVALGAAIVLAGQILNWNKHWPAAVLLWAIGCALTWLILGHWTQGALCAVLFPWWLAGEWDLHVSLANSRGMLPVWVGVCALSFAYLSARRSSADGPLRQALGWLGGLALLPAGAILACDGQWGRAGAAWRPVDWLAWAVALLVPLGVALALDRRRAAWTAGAIAWTGVLGAIGTGAQDSIAMYGWCTVGAAGLAAWGIRNARAERVNLAVAGLAVTVMAFYYSSIMDKLGRSASLIGMGLLFLGGGWVLERTRHRLLAYMPPNVPLENGGSQRG
jgi:uncharacterized membrane protein